MPNPPTKDYPLRHQAGYHFQLLEEDTGVTDFATIIPFFFADQAKDEDAAESIHVHPLNDDFATTGNAGLHMNSRVNNIHIAQYIMVPAAYDVPDMLCNMMNIAWGIDDHATVAADGTTLLANIKFQKNADTISPDYTGTDLPLTNVWPSDCDGLTSDTQGEPVALSPASLDFQRNLGEFHSKLRSMSSKMQVIRIHKDFPYYTDRWFKVPSRCRRANAFTGCFQYIGINTVIADGASAAASGAIIPHFDTDSTIDEPALSVHTYIEFNEYNDAFDKTP